MDARNVTSAILQLKQASQGADEGSLLFARAMDFAKSYGAIVSVAFMLGWKRQ
jgi:hypothetical protein